MASIFDRISGRLSGLLDDITLPDRARTTLDRAESLVGEGRAEEALDALAELEGVRAGLWQTSFLRGLALESLGDFVRAGEALTRAAEIRDSATVRLALGRVATQLDDLRIAREHYEAALRTRPTDQERRDALLSLADVHQMLGQDSRSVPILRQALRLTPDDDALTLRLATVLFHEEDEDGVVMATAALTERPQPDPVAALLEARARLRRNEGYDIELARELLLKVLDPDDPRAEFFEVLAQTYMADRRDSEALPLLQQALSLAEFDAHARIHRQIGDCYARSADPKRALDSYRAAVALDPQDLEAQRSYARAALDQRIWVEAKGAALRARDLAPDDRTAAALLGRAHIGLNEVSEARAVLSALRAARMSIDELQALGELALATADAVEAIALLREARVRQPNRSGIAEALEDAYRMLAPSIPTPAERSDLSPATLAPMLDALGSAVATHPLLTDLLPRTTALRQQLDEPLTIAVLGEFNAGKSTLINAFVGEQMVAMGVLPTTSHINVIRYGPRKVARWLKTDGSVSELPYEEASRLVKDRPQDIVELEFCYPHPDLRSIHFWDTPGFNAPVDEHEERARTALQTADAVIWMLDAGQALTASEYDTIDDLEEPEERLLVVVNKIDRLGADEEALRQIQEHVESGLKLPHAGFFALSARNALLARQAEREGEEGAAHLLESSRWSALDGAIRDTFFKRSGRLKSLEVARNVVDLIEGVLERTESASATVASARSELSAERRWLIEQGNRWFSDVLRPSFNEAARAFQELRVRIAEEIVQLSTPRLSLFSRRRLLSEDREVMIGQVLDRAEAIFDGVLTRLVEHLTTIDQRLIASIERWATRLGPPESRNLRRRLEAYLAEIEALRRLLSERCVDRPVAILRARLEDQAAEVFDTVATDSGRTRGERDARLQRLLPATHEGLQEAMEAWGAEYFSAGERLCDHVERDLDILALDLEHRILRPFSMLRDQLSPSVRPDDGTQTHESTP